MTAVDESEGGRVYDRRRFLTRLGVGAAAVAGGGTLSPARAYGARAGHGVVNRTSFTRIFFDLPPFSSQSPKIEKALRELGKPGGLLDAMDPLSAGPVQLITNPALSANNPNNPEHTAGTTFVGQFVDHDITFDVGSRLGQPSDPLESTN